MRRILVERGPLETRIARLDDERLVEIEIQPVDEAVRVGAILLGPVRVVVPALSAAFVDIGGGPEGFLPLGRGRPPNEGAAVRVQVTRPATADKGPRLSLAANLVGHRLVLTPDGAEIRLSPRLKDKAERRRLATWAEDFRDGRGAVFTLRRNAAGAGLDRLDDEAEHLIGRWRGIETREAEALSVLDPDDDEIHRLLVEVAGEDIEITFDELDDLARARAWCRRFRPETEGRLHHHAGPVPLFTALAVEAEIEAALEREVALPSGGWLHIEPTRALTAIDVDSAGDGGAAARARTARRVNLEAAVEITRQLRLRSVGGLVVVDFLNLSQRADRAAVLAALDEGFAEDPTAVRHGGFSSLGLVEIARTRTRPSLAERLLSPDGRRPNARALASAMLRGAAGETVRGAASLRLVAAPEVIAAIPAPERAAAFLAHRLGRTIELLAEDGLARETWRLEAGELR